MEKFSKWRDAGTGIQPFLQPVPARTQQSIVGRVLGAFKSYIAGPVVAVVRLAALAVLAALDAVAAGAQPLFIVARARRMYARATRSVLARAALFVMGFYRVDVRTVGLRRGQRGRVQSQGAEPGDVIVANHVSYIDVLWLVAAYDPVFVALDNASTYARPISAWAALRAPALATPALLRAGDARPLREITQDARARRRGPVVVFPENATTNGRALLKLLPVFGAPENLDEKARIHVMAFKYPAHTFSPAFSVGSQFAHLFGVCAQVYNSLIVRVLAQDECPRVAESASFCDADAEPVDLDDAVTDRLLQLSRLRMTKLSAMDKRDFLSFYQKRAKGYKVNI